MKILIIGNYGAKNIGDEMILRGLINILQQTFSNPKITVLSGDPTETRATHHVNSFPKFPAGIRSFISFFDKKNRQNLNSLREADIVYFGGGGLFGGISSRADFIWLMQGLAVVAMKKPLIICGQSVGEISNPIVKFFLKKIFKHAQKIILRDPISARRIEDLGIKNTLIAPDLAFFSEKNDIQKTRPSINPRQPSRIIVALRQTNQLTDNKINDLVRFLSEKQANGFKVTLINFQEGSETDHILHSKLKAADPNFSIIQNPTFSELKKYYAEAAFCIGMRLHSIIYSIMSNTPFIAISYDTKIADLLRGLDLATFMIDLENLSFESLSHAFSKLLPAPPHPDQMDVRQLLEEKLAQIIGQSNDYSILTP